MTCWLFASVYGGPKYVSGVLLPLLRRGCGGCSIGLLACNLRGPLWAHWALDESYCGRNRSSFMLLGLHFGPRSLGLSTSMWAR